jgi:hypothetical protein
MDLVAALLSKEGYNKVLAIMEGDEVLKSRSRPKGVAFGKAEYYISLLGKPSPTEPWMLQFGGHHLALNWTARRVDAEPDRGSAGHLHAERENGASARRGKR